MSNYKLSLKDVIHQYYYLSRKEASQETRLNLSSFPMNNPFTLTEILDSDFFPIRLLQKYGQDARFTVEKS